MLNCNRFFRTRGLVPLVVFATAALLADRPALGQAVPTCQALTLYGNAALAGVCTRLSPATQNLWVCELANTPDVHTTFNATTALHVTVRDTSCQGRSDLTGTFPGALAIGAGQPAAICGVSVQAWVAGLNAVPQVPAGTTGKVCLQPFLDAWEGGSLSPGDAQSYMNVCKSLNCP